MSDKKTAKTTFAVATVGTAIAAAVALPVSDAEATGVTYRQAGSGWGYEGCKVHRTPSMQQSFRECATYRGHLSGRGIEIIVCNGGGGNVRYTAYDDGTRVTRLNGTRSTICNDPHLRREGVSCNNLPPAKFNCR